MYKRYINSIIIIIIIINDNCRRSFLFRDVLILYISQESQDDCLYFDFALFKLALWPTLRRKFMNFWSFLTPPGNKHDEKISNCFSTPSLLQAHDSAVSLTMF